MKRMGVWSFCFACLLAMAGKLDASVPTLAEPSGSPRSEVAAPSISWIAGGGTVELGARVSLTVRLVTDEEGLVFQWRKAGVPFPGANTRGYVIPSAGPEDAAIYGVTVSNQAGSATAEVQLTVLSGAAPVILAQPRGGVWYVGQVAAFSVVAAGSSPRSYQWRRNGVDIPGAVDSAYLVGAVTTVGTDLYSVVVTNPFGSVASAEAALELRAAVPVEIHPILPVDVATTRGASATLYVNLTAGTYPLSYQWMKSGKAIPGATSGSLRFESVTDADAAKYSVLVSNPAGSAVSREATLTVNPPTPVTFRTQPLPVAIFEDQTASMTATAEGSPPLSYQWLKDGVEVAGATARTLEIRATRLSDAGQYSLRVTNPAGPFVSAPAPLTVNPAVAPAITRQPQGAKLAYRGSVRLNVEVSGSPPLRFKWRRNGVDLPNASDHTSSFWLSSSTPVDNGDYTVEVSNAAGSVTSLPATVEVEAAKLPVIVQSPKSQGVAVRRRAFFDVSIDSTGAGYTSLRWLRNGWPVGPWNSLRLEINSVSTADAGDYTVEVTSDAGIVVSAPARLTVLSAEPPKVVRSAAEVWVSIGTSTVLSVEVTGSPPFAYQWFKQGVPIQGATDARLVFSAVTEADLVDYTVTVTNEGGIATSPPAALRLQRNAEPPPLPWIDAARQENVVYFLASGPNRIERYDLAQQRWLAPVMSSGADAPTAIAAGSEGIYIAYGRRLARRSLDLATEQTIATTTNPNKRLFLFEKYLYYDGAPNSSPGNKFAYGTVNRVTLEAGLADEFSTIGGGLRALAIAPTLRKAFARSEWSGAQLKVVAIAGDGSLGRLADDPFGSFDHFPFATRVFVFPNEQWLSDDAGTVFRTSDHEYVGSLGSPFDDLGFLGDGTPVVLRREKLTTADAGTLLETGRATLAKRGVRLFVRDRDVFVFGAAAASNGDFSVEKVSVDSFTPTGTLATGPMPTTPFSIDDAFLGDDEVLHVFSRSLQGFVRWSVATGEFLPRLILRDAPLLASHAPGRRRAVLLYTDGQITELPLRNVATAERPIAALNLHVRSLVDLEDGLAFTLDEGQSTGDFRMLVKTGSHQVDDAHLYYGDAFAWQPASRRLYSSSDMGDRSLQYEFISSPPTWPDARKVGPTKDLIPPLRLSSDGSRIVTVDGSILDADLVRLGRLPNEIVDASWSASGFYSLRTSGDFAEVQQWSPSAFSPLRSVLIPGRALRLFSLSQGRLAVISVLSGVPLFTVLNSDLSVAASRSPLTVLTAQPQSQASAPAGTALLSTTQAGAGGETTYQWNRNGASIPGSEATLRIVDMQPVDAGIYTVDVAQSGHTVSSQPAIVGMNATIKVVGAASEHGTDIVHPSGRIFDQVLLQGTAASITADAGQVTRVSYVDLNDDIVQVEFSGAGTLTLLLSGSSGPAAPAHYNQPDVRYMRGHASLVISGADETTNVSVFSVGRANAVNQSLFREGIAYDGVADVGYIAILSRNGKFGGVRCANASFFAAKGLTGIYAPGVEFTGPVYVGDITAFDQADAVLSLGSARGDTWITGGGLAQPNARAVKVSGLTQLKFVAGTNSHGNALTAQANRARLEQDGVDVTAQIVVNPVAD